MTLRQAAQMALDALEETATCPKDWPLQYEKEEKAIAALRAALAEPEQEPVAWMYVNMDGECEQIEYLENEPMPDDPSITPLYTAPTPRKPLTDEEIGKIAGDTLDAWSCARAIEKAHGIGEQT